MFLIQWEIRILIPPREGEKGVGKMESITVKHVKKKPTESWSQTCRETEKAKVFRLTSVVSNMTNPSPRSGLRSAADVDRFSGSTRSGSAMAEHE